MDPEAIHKRMALRVESVRDNAEQSEYHRGFLDGVEMLYEHFVNTLIVLEIAEEKAVGGETDLAPQTEALRKAQQECE